MSRLSRIMIALWLCGLLMAAPLAYAQEEAEVTETAAEETTEVPQGAALYAFLLGIGAAVLVGAYYLRVERAKQS